MRRGGIMYCILKGLAIYLGLAAGVYGIIDWAQGNNLDIFVWRFWLNVYFLECGIISCAEIFTLFLKRGLFF